MNLKKKFLNKIFLFLVILKLIECESEKIYNIVALGNTGVGKSSLLNMLAGYFITCFFIRYYLSLIIAFSKYCNLK